MNRKNVKYPQATKQLFIRIIALGIISALIIHFTVRFFGLILYQRKSRNKQDKPISNLLQYNQDVFKAPSFLHTASSEANLKTRIKIPIIMYHYVEYVKDPADSIRKRLDTTPYQFEQQLISLKNNKYETYFVKDIPEILSGSVAYSTRSAVLTFDDGYEDFYTNAFPLLEKYHIRATLFLIVNNIGKRGFLSHTQIVKLLDSGLVEIGSHTLSHPNLKYISDVDARREIKESKAKLEYDFGIRVETFAYPFGAFNKKTIEIVNEASYSAAVSVISGTLQSEDAIYYLSRVRSGLSSSDLVSAIEKLSH